MRSTLLRIFLFVTLLFPCATQVAFSGSVPNAADKIAKQLDEQLIKRYARLDIDKPKSRQEAELRANTVILGTAAANISDLNASCPLARQVTEEISRYLISKGYRFQELRKGSYIRFHPTTGELILTRDVRQLASTRGTGHAVLAGTYVVSGDNVRFSMRLIRLTNNEVLAMGTATIPLSDDVAPLLYDMNTDNSVPGIFGTGTRLQ